MNDEKLETLLRERAEESYFRQHGNLTHFAEFWAEAGPELVAASRADLEAAETAPVATAAPKADPRITQIQELEAAGNFGEAMNLKFAVSDEQARGMGGNAEGFTT